MQVNKACGQCGGLVEKTSRTQVTPMGAVWLHQTNEQCRVFLETTFEQEVRAGIVESKNLGYTPTAFIHMVNEHGAVQATKRLLGSTNPAEGFYS